jgi:hypothetical protein
MESDDEEVRSGGLEDEGSGSLLLSSAIIVVKPRMAGDSIEG